MGDPAESLFAVLQYETLGVLVEAEVDHGDQGDEVSDDKCDIQRESVAEKSVDHGGNCSAAHGCGAYKTEDGASVFLGERKHCGGGKNSISCAI